MEVNCKRIKYTVVNINYFKKCFFLFCFKYNHFKSLRTNVINKKKYNIFYMKLITLQFGHVIKKTVLHTNCTYLNFFEMHNIYISAKNYILHNKFVIFANVTNGTSRNCSLIIF